MKISFHKRRRQFTRIIKQLERELRQSDLEVERLKSELEKGVGSSSSGNPTQRLLKHGQKLLIRSG